MAITHFGMGGLCTRTVGSSGLKLKAKLGHISPAAMRRAKLFINVAAVCDVRFGSKADMCGAKQNVRFTPNSDRESEFPQKAMSALPLKAGHVRCNYGCPLWAKSGHVHRDTPSFTLKSRHWALSGRDAFGITQ